MKRSQAAVLATTAFCSGIASWRLYSDNLAFESSLMLFMAAGVYWFIIVDMDVDKMLTGAQVRLAEDA